MADHQHDKVRSRNEAFSDKVSSKISSEDASFGNPYIAENVRWYGYDVEDLMQNASLVEVFYLMFRGELPSAADARLLETLMVALINPGPRHPATRAAMNVGVGKTETTHILPVSTAVMGGEYLGGGSIESAMRFFRKYSKKDPEDVATSFADALVTDASSIPGFGKYYGDTDIFSAKIVQSLLPLSQELSALHWGSALASALASVNIGWLMPGVAAAVFSDLGFHPRSGAGLFQLMSAPGLLAHGLELANKPITAMPYVSDDNYVIDTPSKA
ncbi:hypothetical protein TDB9533_02030 [Thalassocella blandensis]|nr:hypothetical protein TDB9533_02030 [Thalassocella blandensis]